MPPYTENHSIPHIRFSTLWMQFNSFLYGIIWLFSIGMFIHMVSTGDMEGIVFSILFGAIISNYFIFAPYEVETTSEGLILRYFWRATRVVAWSDIWRVVVRYNRGEWCTIRFGSGLFGRAIFCMDGFLLSSSSNPLVRAIADAAQLTVVGHTFWGRPIYGRSQR